MDINREVFKKIKEIEIKTRKLVNESMAGEYHSVFKGQGMEYEEVREYQEGDDIRNIDWNVSSRTGILHVKKFVEERELTVILAIDTSASLWFGSKTKTKEEIAAEIGAILSLSAIKNNDRVGLLLFSDKIEKYIPPKKGRKHVLRIIREILTSKSENSKTDISVALNFILKVEKKRGIVFLISDFFDDDFESEMKLVSKKHDLVAICVNDPKEFDFPAKIRGFFEDIEFGDEIGYFNSDKKNISAYQNFINSFIEKRNKIFNRYKIDRIELFTHEEYDKKLISFFKMRMRKLR